MRIAMRMPRQVEQAGAPGKAVPRRTLDIADSEPESYILLHLRRAEFARHIFKETYAEAVFAGTDRRVIRLGLIDRNTDELGLAPAVSIQGLLIVTVDRDF